VRANNSHNVCSVDVGARNRGIGALRAGHPDGFKLFYDLEPYEVRAAEAD
jgi:hypothetical protein